MAVAVGTPAAAAEVFILVEAEEVPARYFWVQQILCTRLVVVAEVARVFLVVLAEESLELQDPMAVAAVRLQQHQELVALAAHVTVELQIQAQATTVAKALQTATPEVAVAAAVTLAAGAVNRLDATQLAVVVAAPVMSIRLMAIRQF